jgi:hypothetical protein
LDHYLEVLKAKPGGLPGATALARPAARSPRRIRPTGTPPVARGDAAGTRALIEILLAHRTMTAAVLIAAMDRAVLLGDSGTGKSHLLIGLGLAACEQGRRVRYVTTAQLVNELVEAADERVLSRVVGRYGQEQPAPRIRPLTHLHVKAIIFWIACRDTPSSRAISA